MVRNLLLALCMISFVGPASATGFSDLSSAIDVQNWQGATIIAASLDSAQPGSDFFQLYVEGSRLASGGSCDAAIPVLTALIAVQPRFLPAYELKYLCDKQVGALDEARKDLEAIVSILPNGPERSLVAQMLENEKAQGEGLGISLFGNVAPSTNANRQTAATTLKGLTINQVSRGSAGINGVVGASLTKRLFERDDFFVAGVLRPEISYSTVTQLLTPALTAEVPLTFTMSPNWQLALAPFATAKFSVNGIEEIRLGITGTSFHRLGTADTLIFQTSATRIDYNTLSFMDGWNFVGTAAWSHSLGPQTLLTSQVTIDADLADNSANSRIETSASLRVDHAWENGIFTAVEGRLGMRFHNQPPPLSFGPNQQDVFATGRVELGHNKLTVGPFLPFVYLQSTRQFSDNVFYDYLSHDVGIGVRAKM